jgi:hypothetical protein
MKDNLIPEPTTADYSDHCPYCGAESVEDTLCYNCQKQIPDEFTCWGCDMDYTRIDFGGWVNDRQGCICKECRRDYDREYEESITFQPEL